MSKALGILSGKGGVGKTTLTANLAMAFLEFDQETLVVDTNVKASSLGLHLGFYDDLPVTLREISEGEAPIHHGIFLHPIYNGLRFLPAPIEGGKTKLNNLGKLMKNLKEDYDLLLCDLAPAFSEEAMKAVRKLDQALIVSTPRIPAVTDAMRTARILHENDKEVLGIVLNKVEGSEDELSVEEVEESCDEKVIAEIPRDDDVKKGVAEGDPVVRSHPRSPASREIKKLAAQLLGIEWEPPGLLDQVKGFLGFEGGGKVERSEVHTRRVFGKEERKEAVEEEKFICENCGKVFDSERGLHIHQSKAHS